MKQEFFGNLILPDRVIYGGKLVCEDGVIVAVEENGTDRKNLPYILPGLVDIHNHGAMAHDYMESTDEAFDAISAYLVAHGVTTAQCATVSAPLEQILQFLTFYRNRVAQYEEGSGCRFCGIHIEGPYISFGKKGAHPADTLRTGLDGYDWLIENKDVIGEITVAPELPGMKEMIRDLATAGILVSGGHDDAEPEDILSAVEQGMNHCTHIYCAMSTLHKTGIQRRTGLCEYAMTHSEITAEMIADNHHIPPVLAKMIYQAKGADQLCIVSDAIAPTGLPESDQMYRLGTGENCTKVYVEDGIALVEDRSCYAGSVQSLDKMIGNLVFDCNIPLVDAVRMASLTPAVIIGQADVCGSLAVGKRADLCWMNSDLEVIQTAVAGKIIYKKEE